MAAIKQKKKQNIWQRFNQKRRDYLAARPHHSFRRTPRRRAVPVVASIKNVALGSLKTIRENKKLLVGLSLIYVIITYIFVGGIAQSDFVDLKNATVQVFGGSFNSVGTVFSLLTSTMSGAFNSNLTELQQFLAVFIAFMFWLSLVWALRMRFADQTVKIRDALYNSGAPIVAYVVVILVIILQLSPGAIGIMIVSTASVGGFLQGGVEVMAFSMAAFLLCCLSIYWVSSSLLALVIVTLPNMYPWRALSMASELVIGRRLRLIAHVATLVAILFLLWVVFLLPALLLDSWLRWDWLPLVPIMVQLLGAATLVYAATYIYKLYRSLL